MKKVKNMTLGELAAFICTRLKAEGISCTLTGGACVSIHTSNKFQSYDLDFIPDFGTDRKDIRRSLQTAGFIENGRYFKSDETRFFIEFPPGPLAVGSEPVKEIITLEFPTGTLSLLSPTDSVKDRLSAYYHWDDRQCLEQAELIARDNPVNLTEIRRWSEAEGMSGKFKSIRKRLIHG